jgi:4'-phosphopantetheinyl transferase
MALPAYLRYLKLNSNEIHIWISRAGRIRQTELLKHYQNLLTEDELLKQNSYVCPKKRHSALITRAFVRDLLSRYVNLPPHLWRFKQNLHGKPEIINPSLPLRFNISHTDDVIICAVTLNDDIGCDVEMIHRSCPFLSIAEINFSPEEFSDLLKTPEKEQRSRFFDYWTLKEAYIKTCSMGFSLPLTEFSFQIGVSRSEHENGNIQLEFSAREFGCAKVWRSWLFYPNNNHRIAVSVRRKTGCQTQQFGFRFFESIPLVNTLELSKLRFRA